MQPPPDDPTACKNHQLLAMGMSPEYLEESVKLFAGLGWPTKVAEQGHASASTIMKRRKDSNSGTVQARAAILQAQPLVCEDPEHAKGDQARRSNRLKKKQPQRVIGRRIFVKALLGQATSSEAVGKKWQCIDVGWCVT